MSGPFPGAGSNPLAGGSSANTPATNPLAGGLLNQNPAQGAPASGSAGSNPLAGGSSDTPATNPPTNGNQTTTDDNAPISADVYREKARSEAALRKRVQELEERVKREDDAKLTKEQITQREIEDYRTKEQTWQRERQELRLMSVVENHVRDRNLVSPSAVRAILMAEYADQLDYDEQGTPVNAQYLIDRAVEKYPFLVQPAPQSPVPGSGRPVSPPRAPNGQYSATNARQQNAQPQPTPTAQWPRLSDIDWTKPGGQG